LTNPERCPLAGAALPAGGLAKPIDIKAAIAIKVGIAHIGCANVVFGIATIPG
jgi:hypothetical protein